MVITSSLRIDAAARPHLINKAHGDGEFFTKTNFLVTLKLVPILFERVELFSIETPTCSGYVTKYRTNIALILKFEGCWWKIRHVEKYDVKTIDVVCRTFFSKSNKKHRATFQNKIISFEISFEYLPYSASVCGIIWKWWKRFANTPSSSFKISNDPRFVWSNYEKGNLPLPFSYPFREYILLLDTLLLLSFEDTVRRCVFVVSKTTLLR